MKKPRKKLPTLSEIKDSPSILTRTRLNARRRKALEHTGPMSTPKISVSLDGTSLTWRMARNYQGDAEELLWRYKAQKAIIQNLRAALIAAGLPISDKLMDPTLNTFKYFYVPKKAETTSETGQTKTSPTNFE